MKLSIIMPVYNLPELTKRAMDSIPYDLDLEVIVVNDGSTEDMSFIQDYPVNYFYYEKNENCGHARNIALDLCKGDYIYGMDNDDYLITERFRQAVDELDGTDIVFIDAEVNDGSVWHMNKDNRQMFCAFWTKFIKRDLIGKTRCIETNYLDDYYFTEEILAKPHTEKFTGIVAYRYNYPRENSIIWKKDRGL